jgi:hypothetical protein
MRRTKAEVAPQARLDPLPKLLIAGLCSDGHLPLLYAMPPKETPRTTSSSGTKKGESNPSAPRASRKSARLAAKAPQQRPKLPADVLTEILLLLESFDDLGRVILAHSSFHDAFYAHRRAVLQRVARNLAGPDADDAFGLVKDLVVNALVYGFGKSKDLLVVPADVEMSAADVRELQRIFKVVDDWERIFELLIKDPQARWVYAFQPCCADVLTAITLGAGTGRPCTTVRFLPGRPTGMYILA